MELFCSYHSNHRTIFQLNVSLGHMRTFILRANVIRLLYLTQYFAISTLNSHSNQRMKERKRYTQSHLCAMWDWWELGQCFDCSSSTFLGIYALFQSNFRNTLPCGECVLHTRRVNVLDGRSVGLLVSQLVGRWVCMYVYINKLW